WHHQRGPYCRRQCHGAHGVRDWSGQEDQADADLPYEQRTQFRRGIASVGFDSAFCKAQRGYAGELEAGAGRDHSHLGLGRPGQAEISRRLEDLEALSASGGAAEVVGVTFRTNFCTNLLANLVYEPGSAYGPVI